MDTALPAGFYQRSAPEVARDLLGAVLISTAGGESVAGWISETEAYLGVDDPASHAYRGRRHAGNVGIYSDPGSWYVYRSYGIHWCANVVTGPAGVGAAVLLRALIPEEGLPVIHRRRRREAFRGLTDGPGKLAEALGIDRALDGQVIGESCVRILTGRPPPADEVRVTPRVGITKAREWPLRFLWEPTPARRAAP